MLVQVHWTNNHYDYVEDYMLDRFIEMGVVSRFLRSSGWVKVGIDPIRGDVCDIDYAGTERRTGAM